MKSDEPANRDFNTLYRLLRNINFVPTMTDCDSGSIFEVIMRPEVLRHLPLVNPGSEPDDIGKSIILVCQDIQHGLLAFRLARSPHDHLQIAST